MSPRTISRVRVPSIPALIAVLMNAATRPALTIIDFDRLSEADVETINATRRRSWPGTIIGLGRVLPTLAFRWRVHQDIARPFGSETLRKAVIEVAFSSEVTIETRADSDCGATQVP